MSPVVTKVGRVAELAAAERAAAIAEQRYRWDPSDTRAAEWATRIEYAAALRTLSPIARASLGRAS